MQLKYKENVAIYKIVHDINKTDNEYKGTINGTLKHDQKTRRMMNEDETSKNENKIKEATRKFKIQKAVEFILEKTGGPISDGKNQDKYVLPAVTSKAAKAGDTSRPVKLQIEEVKVTKKMTEAEIANERQLKLQAQANKIDRLISEVEMIKNAKNSKMKESSAYPNNKDVNPQVFLTMLEAANSDAKELKMLKEYLKSNGDSVTYQDTVKFLLLSRMKKRKTKSSLKFDPVFNSKSRYIMPESCIDEEIHSETEEISESDVEETTQTKMTGSSESEDLNSDPDSSTLDLKSEKTDATSKPNKSRYDPKKTVKQLMGDLYDEEKLNQMRIKPTSREVKLKFTPTSLYLEKKDESLKKKTTIDKNRGCECIIY